MTLSKKNPHTRIFISPFQLKVQAAVAYAEKGVNQLISKLCSFYTVYCNY